MLKSYINQNNMKCSIKGCGQELTMGVANFSNDVYKKLLCIFHQQEQRRKESPKLDAYMRKLEDPEYEEAISKATTAVKYGSTIDVDALSRDELVSWAQQEI